MFIRNLMITALVVPTLTGMHLAPEASAAEQNSGLIAGRLGRQPNTSYRSVGSSPLPLVADLVKESTILEISSADRPGKTLRLWYDEPAPDSNAGWVNRSIPMGNG